MPRKITISNSSGELDQAFGTILGSARSAINLTKVYIKAFTEWAKTDLSRELQENLAGRALGRRSGNLESSTKVGAVQVDGKIIETNIESTAPYALIQELGGVINAAQGKFLAVPLPAVQDAKGSVTRSFSSFMSDRDTFIQTSKNGNRLLFRNLGGTLLPLFVLKQSVTIPGTGFASDAVERAQPMLRPRVGKFVDEELRRAFSG